MTGSTVNEGFPYPLTSDFADVQDVFRLATAVDRELRAQQAPMRAFMGRPSFIGRLTANMSTFLSGTQSMTIQAIDWDNTGGLTVGTTSWRQPFAMAPSWWLFGSTMFTNVAVAPVVGEGVMSELQLTTVDQVTNVSSTTGFYQRNDESNTSGEWINNFAMAAMFRGSATSQLHLNGTTLKGMQAGSRLWGMYLGPVN